MLTAVTNLGYRNPGEIDRVFHALGDPTRRAIVKALTDGPRSVSGLASPLDMTLSAVVQHLQVLGGERPGDHRKVRPRAHLPAGKHGTGRSRQTGSPTAARCGSSGSTASANSSTRWKLRTRNWKLNPPEKIRRATGTKKS